MTSVLADELEAITRKWPLVLGDDCVALVRAAAVLRELMVVVGGLALYERLTAEDGAGNTKEVNDGTHC